MVAVDEDYLSVMEVTSLSITRSANPTGSAAPDEEVDPTDSPTVDFVFKADLGSDN